MIGPLIGFLARHWGKAALAGVGLDHYFNDGKISKSAWGIAEEKATEIGQKGLEATASELGAKFREGIDTVFGAESGVGNFLSEHWGKIALGALSLGLFKYGSGGNQLMGIIGLGVVAYMAYSHVAKDGFNVAASGHLTRPIVDMRALREKSDQLIGTGATFAQPLLKPIVTQTEPHNN